MSEFETLCQSCVIDSIGGFAACVHIVNALRNGPSHSCLYVIKRDMF